MKAIFYVCSAIRNGKLISQAIEAASEEEAAQLFFEAYSCKSYTTLGPFYKKRVSKEEVKPVVKFSKETKKAIYDGWNVNAFILDSPIDHAFIG